MRSRIWSWVFRFGKWIVLRMRGQFYRPARRSAVGSASSFGSDIATAPPTMSTQRPDGITIGEPNAPGSPVEARPSRCRRPGRARWFGKFFPAHVVWFLSRLRGKPRRRFRDHLLTVLGARGFERLRGLLLGRQRPRRLSAIFSTFSQRRIIIRAGIGADVRGQAHRSGGNLRNGRPRPLSRRDGMNGDYDDFGVPAELTRQVFAAGDEGGQEACSRRPPLPRTGRKPPCAGACEHQVIRKTWPRHASRKKKEKGTNR